MAAKTFLADTGYQRQSAHPGRERISLPHTEKTAFIGEEKYSEGEIQMKLQDALINWLQIKIVAEARPKDEAAHDTLRFFEEILREDHKLSSFGVDRTDDTMVFIRYESEGISKTQMFDREYAWKLLTEIEAEPKYNQ